MYTIHSLIFLASVLLTAFCLTGIIAGVRNDADKRYWKRREEGYQRHKALLREQRILGKNREQLWKGLMK